MSSDSLLGESDRGSLRVIIVPRSYRLPVIACVVWLFRASPLVQEENTMFALLNQMNGGS